MLVFTWTASLLLFTDCQVFFLDDHIVLGTILTVSVGNTQRLLGDYANPEYKIYYLPSSEKKQQTCRRDTKCYSVCMSANLYMIS